MKVQSTNFLHSILYQITGALRNISFAMRKYIYHARFVYRFYNLQHTYRKRYFRRTRTANTLKRHLTDDGGMSLQCFRSSRWSRGGGPLVMSRSTQ